MSRTQQTAKKYFGNVASGYEARRASQTKWQREQAIVADWLARHPAGTRILDCPVGTGRFLPLYALHGFEVLGVDISTDMLRQAEAKGPVESVTLRQGSIFDLGEPDASFDVALAIRIVNLIDRADMQRALRELQRVTRAQIIFNLREGEPGRYRNPHPLSAVSEALAGSWRIAENVEIHEADFRMIRLECFA